MRFYITIVQTLNYFINIYCKKDNEKKIYIYREKNYFFLHYNLNIFI